MGSHNGLPLARLHRDVARTTVHSHPSFTCNWWVPGAHWHRDRAIAGDGARPPCHRSELALPGLDCIFRFASFGWDAGINRQMISPITMSCHSDCRQLPAASASKASVVPARAAPPAVSRTGSGFTCGKRDPPLLLNRYRSVGLWPNPGKYLRRVSRGAVNVKGWYWSGLCLLKQIAKFGRLLIRDRSGTQKFPSVGYGTFSQQALSLLQSPPEDRVGNHPAVRALAASRRSRSSLGTCSTAFSSSLTAPSKSWSASNRCARASLPRRKLAGEP